MTIDKPKHRRLPGALSMLSAVVILLASTQLVVGALSVGVSADEPWHVYRTQNLIDHGWYVVGTDRGSPLDTQYAYGPGFSMPAHLLATAVGVESGDKASETADAYEFRHVLVALICLLTAFAVWACVRLLTRSNPSALWASAALLCIPLWLGMGMFDIKDIPVAAGYTLFTTALVLSLSPRLPARRSLLLAIAALCAGGVILSFGVRFGMWVAIAASLGLWSVIALTRRRSGEQVSAQVVAAVAAGTLLGAALVAVAYPAAFAEPIELLTNAVSVSARFPSPHVTNTAGTAQSSFDPALWYLPAWTFAVVPVLIFIFASYGVGAWLWRSGTSLRDPGVGRYLRGSQAPVLLVALQLLLLPVAAIISDAHIYNGMRQHLYVIPAIAIFAGLGLARVRKARWFVAPSRPWRRMALTLIAVLALLLPLLEQTRLFPFNYTYISPVAGIGGVQDNWLTEYWWASNREAVGEAPADSPVICLGDLQLISFSNCPRHVAAFIPRGTPRFDPRQPTKRPVAVVVPVFDLEYLPRFCRVEAEITRPIRTETMTLSRILACDSKQVAKRFSDVGLYERKRMPESRR